MANLSESKAKTLPLNQFMAQFLRGLKPRKSYADEKKKKA